MQAVNALVNVVAFCILTFFDPDNLSSRLNSSDFFHMIDYHWAI